MRMTGHYSRLLGLTLSLLAIGDQEKRPQSYLMNSSSVGKEMQWPPCDRDAIGARLVSRTKIIVRSFLSGSRAFQCHETFSGDQAARVFLDGKAIPVELCVDEPEAALLLQENYLRNLS